MIYRVFQILSPNPTLSNDEYQTLNNFMFLFVVDIFQFDKKKKKYTKTYQGRTLPQCTVE